MPSDEPTECARAALVATTRDPAPCDTLRTAMSHGEQHVELNCRCRVRLRTGHLQLDAVAMLIGGRDRHSVGGEIAEGPRWWHGQLRLGGDAIDAIDAIGAEVDLELDDGRTAVAVVEDIQGPPEPELAVRGVGVPPFDVDASWRDHSCSAAGTKTTQRRTESRRDPPIPWNPPPRGSPPQVR